MEKQHGHLLVIDGPSAVGKSTIIDALLAQTDLPLHVSKRVTTRPRRPNDDPNYIFIDYDKFNQMIEAEELLEHHHYLFGMSYGLPKKDVNDKLKEGKNLIGMINLGNFSEVRKQIPNCFGVFLNASLDTIRFRLESRETHTEEQIEERLGNAKKAQQYMADYNLVIKNQERSIASVTQEIVNSFRDFVQEVQK